jgi:hypothetical protein
MELNNIDILDDLQEELYNVFQSDEYTIMNSYSKDVYEQKFREVLQNYLEGVNENLSFDIISNYNCNNNSIKINIIPKDEYTKRFLECNGYVFEG